MKKVEYEKFIKEVDKEYFINFYKNNGNKAVCEEFSCTLNDMYKIVKDLDIYLTKEEKNLRNKYGTEQAVFKKYGVTNVFLLPEMQDYCKQRCFEEYGVDNIFKDSKYIKNCFSNKYGEGITNPGQLNDWLTKFKETSLKNWGTEYPMQNEEVKNKVRQKVIAKLSISIPKGINTKIKNYGENYAKIISEKASKTIEERYDVPYFCMHEKCRSALDSKNNSKPNKNIENLLIENNISYIKEFSLENYQYDFKVGNILIEVNPTATHNSSWSPFTDGKPKDKYYHQNKSLTALKNNYFCFIIWDWTKKEALIDFLQKYQDIDELKLEIHEPTKIIYNFKEDKILSTNEETENLDKYCVIVYDDGITILN